MEWNSFVCFTVDKENGREPVNNSGKGKTERDVTAFVVLFVGATLPFI